MSQGPEHPPQSQDEQCGQDIVARAEARAEAIVAGAQEAAEELHIEIVQLMHDLERRRHQMRQEHSRHREEMTARERRLRSTVRSEYKKIVDEAQSTADDVLRRTRERCDEYNAETERIRTQALLDIQRQKENVDLSREHVTSRLHEAVSAIDECTSALAHHAVDPTAEAGPTEQHDSPADSEASAEQR